MSVAIAILLGLSVAASLLGAVAFHRLATPLERLHAGSFATIVSGFPLVVAAFLTEGFAGRPIKLALLYVIIVVSGALANHAVARAIHLRGGVSK